uniref:Uncharacterized protein n=1 Tax=Anguilla anguilla TaxID=7936 RepID=A0A0E9V226_ANGAN
MRSDVTSSFASNFSLFIWTGPYSLHVSNDRGGRHSTHLHSQNTVL